MSKCDHSTPQWHLADCNEDGWKCAECLHVFGFRPDFDREHTRDKVETILFWLVEHDFIYVSNASEADGVVASIAKHCREANTFDQQTIIVLIAGFGITGHAAFWRNQAKQFLCSHPSRSIKDGKSVCNACGYEVMQQGAGPLFDSKEPF